MLNPQCAEVAAQIASSLSSALLKYTCKDTKIPRYQDTKIQGYQDTKILRYHDTKTPRYQDTNKAYVCAVPAVRRGLGADR